jgi:hypothetical protein
LTTLQKACAAAQFDANPAGCPVASVVGHMKVLTPVLPVPLEGPLYFVSNGGEAFPNLIAVLQGYGVTAHLIGDTFIGKTGVTSSTFKAIPDFPFTTAEVTLPQGPYSALAANGNLCQQNLTMPTAYEIGALELHFFGGERSLLSTPAVCGLATGTSALTPWSGSPAVAPSSSFEIDMGMDGTACSDTQPFAPTFQAASTNAGEADTYGSLSLLFSRTASEQQLGAIAIQAPPAVAQLFAGVPACGEPQASEGACPGAGEVEAVAAQAGLGSYPADLNGGST